MSGYGLGLSARELVKNNEERAHDARREMERYDGEISRADRNIRLANTGISQVKVISFTCFFCHRQQSMQRETLNYSCETCCYRSVILICLVRFKLSEK